MSENQVSQRIEALIAPVMTDLGLELYDLEYNGGMVKITVDTPPGSPGGIDVDQLSRCTRLISRELDHDDPVPGHYTLEVSSPGLERNLRLPRHFQREVGKTAAVRLSDVLNGERRLTGVIESAGEETFLLRLANGEERVVSYDRIDRAKTVFVWQAQPKPGKGVGAGGVKGASKKSATTGTPKPSMMSSLPASTADSQQEIDDFLDRCDDLEDLDADLGQDESVQEITSYEDQESAES